MPITDKHTCRIMSCTDAVTMIKWLIYHGTEDSTKLKKRQDTNSF